LANNPRNPEVSAALLGLHDPERDLAGALHDVSNELTVVVGWLGRVRDLLRDHPDARQGVEIALQRAQRGRVIARRAIGAEATLLEMPEEKKPTVDVLLDNATLGVAPQSVARKVEITWRSTADTQSLIVPYAPVALQILTNLLLNAIEFSSLGDHVEVTAKLQDGTIFFAVRDQGPGISEHQRGSLFVQTATTREGGAGIGLAHSHALAHHYGGDLRIHPVSRGSCLVLCWPVASGSTSIDPPHFLQGHRVVILEDDESIATLLLITLEVRGANVVCTQTVEDFFEQLTPEPPTAALVDLSPLGDQAEHWLRELHQRCPGTRVILMTGSTRPLGTEVTQAVFGWVRKPFEISEILAVLTRLAKSP